MRRHGSPGFGRRSVPHVPHTRALHCSCCPARRRPGEHGAGACGHAADSALPNQASAPSEPWSDRATRLRWPLGGTGLHIMCIRYAHGGAHICICRAVQRSAPAASSHSRPRLCPLVYAGHLHPSSPPMDMYSCIHRACSWLTAFYIRAILRPTVQFATLPNILAQTEVS